MKIPFRQGIVKHGIDSAGNQTFLQKSNSGTTIDLIASAVEPVEIAFAHDNSDYLFTEFNVVAFAWNGPFSSGTDFWLFWDISLLDARRTFGYTTLEPFFGPTAPMGIEGQHWFDTSTTVHKVFINGIFKDVIRVFAAKYEQGSILKPFDVGTQVGLDVTSFPGPILFDEENNAIRKFGPRRRTEYITGETPIATFASNQAISLQFESTFTVAEAVGNIPEFHLISYNNQNKIELASSTNTNRVVGLTREDLFDTEIRSFITRGFVSSSNFSFTEDAGTPVFCDETGQVTTTVTQINTIKCVGHVVNASTIFLDIQPLIILQDT